MYDATNPSTIGLGIKKKTNFHFLRVRLKNKWPYKFMIPMKLLIDIF